VAEDILQEAFVRTLDRVNSIRRTDSAVAWFYRVLRNAIADHYRRQEVRDRTLTQVSAEAGGEAPAADKELEAVVCACVMDLVDTLKAEYAAAVRRVDLDGLSVRSYEQVGGRRAACQNERYETDPQASGLRPNRGPALHFAKSR